MLRAYLSVYYNISDNPLIAPPTTLCAGRSTQPLSLPLQRVRLTLAPISTSPVQILAECQLGTTASAAKFCSS